MYLPDHFAADDATVGDLLVNHGSGDLVTATADGLIATTLPFVYDAERHSLRGHVARANPQWSTPVNGEAMVILRGGDFYVTPSWYPTKQENGRVAPSWNYLTAHVYGELVIHDDPEWVLALLHDLAAKHESKRPEPWTVDDAPAKWVAGRIRAVVGLELVISRIEGKAKMSQNRSAEDIDGVITGLDADGNHAGAARVRAANGRA